MTDASTGPAADVRLDRTYVSLPEHVAPRLFVVVDTEEEFDWGKPLSRDQVSVTAMRSIGRLQSVLARWRIVPTYVVDFPIAAQPEGFSHLKELHQSGAAAIGAHLHPWVNPPFTEPLTPRNSFGCALGASLETEKIRILRDRIQESFGMQPTVFKAGRYGFGPTTAAALESLDFTVDVSVNPRMDFTAEGGPTFASFDTRPFFFGRQRRLLEIPCSTDYEGLAARAGRPLHEAASLRPLRWARLVGILARLGIVNRVMLSPEGHTLAEMKAVTRSLFHRGIRTFSLTMHSPSVQPGCTPYVRNAADLDAFLDRINAYCEFFIGELDGVASTPDEFCHALQAA